MKRQKVCPRCCRSVYTYLIVKQDPRDKKKAWKVESCAKCGFNFDLEEMK